VSGEHLAHGTCPSALLIHTRLSRFAPRALTARRGVRHPSARAPGRGWTNGAFLKAGLIDEFSVLVQPAVDGLAGVASIVDYHGGTDERPAAGQSLRHLPTETLDGGIVWLRYRVEPTSPTPS
jgi:hypothetical protein